MNNEDVVEQMIFLVEEAFGVDACNWKAEAIQAYDILCFGYEMNEWRGAAEQLRLASESLEVSAYKVMAERIETHCDEAEKEEAKEAEKLRLKQATKDQVAAQKQLNLF